MNFMTENAALDNLNTFQVAANCRYLVEIRTITDLQTAIEHPRFTADNFLVLGSGSNVLFSGDYPGWVLRMASAGITVVDEDETSVLIKAGAGVNWHDLVTTAVDSGWFGIENLALIPGTVGAAPIQNIGAYGVEFSTVMHSLSAFNMRAGELVTMYPEDCRFGYRHSLFKEAKDFIVTDVTLRLSKQPVLNTTYGGIDQQLASAGIDHPTPIDIKNIVTEIRQSKLPDPMHLGNAGSFFKNPVLPKSTVHDLQADYPALPVFPAGSSNRKISAAWLIEQCGWKGKRIKNCGVYAGHALILVNYGGASGAAIVRLARDITESVFSSFEIRLEPEVRIIG
ncbi:MAG: UDP-N-acetylmuramate dehydrogenase [Candidatus Marinimicrobia bacterium]|nr:UDP-N-acetylmuramate dehydrogenase [Candidatus Neomarinimicrobiota bacterium]